ncbi:DNA polymerase Y family protein [Paludibacterium paludis]|uniref:DNA polymerase IV n=1 Tax=Paludibacterium paludis TaxID=1225769 RepID=A0A918U9J6_9NEIS|nr:DNA polymerase IV [Paludibacterium paludis]GGY13660.1 hypothetical protein GCM10011289_16230 [Paludibacterium paludis]
MKPANERRIAHLDMDAFFASVELLRYPDLRGQPVVIAGRAEHRPVQLADGTRRYSRLRDYAGRGVVTTSTYEARALGVFSAMGVMKAAQLAPDAILLPTDIDAYRQYSRRFKEAVATVVPHYEDRGIDEIYLDLSDMDEDSRTIAQKLKDAVRDATGLSCSICVAPNKLLAKIGSDLDKPDGLTLLLAEDLPTRIWPLPVRKINGIGPKAGEKLVGAGIDTIGALAGVRPDELIATFGPTYGAWLHDSANGRDDRPVILHSEPKSISRETTFERDLHVKLDRGALTRCFTQLCERVAGDLRRKGYAGRTIGIKLRFADFHTVTRDLTLPAPTDDAGRIRQAAGECLRRIVLGQRIRLLGVRVGTLSPAETASPPIPTQGDLFDGWAPQ